jgi:hypothetical protein
MSLTTSRCVRGRCKKEIVSRKWLGHSDARQVFDLPWRRDDSCGL